MKNIIDGISWTEAKTYAAFAPHEYFLQDQYPEAFEYIKAKIESDGKDELFTMPARGEKAAYTLPYRYWYYYGYKYWHMDNVINRALYCLVCK